MIGLIIIFAWALKVPTWIFLGFLRLHCFLVLLRCLTNEIRKKEFYV